MVTNCSERLGHIAAECVGVPGVLEVKLVAASTFLAVPSFMQRSARGAKLLAGYRDHPPARSGAICDVLIALSQMLADLPELAVAQRLAAYNLLAVAVFAPGRSRRTVRQKQPRK